MPEETKTLLRKLRNRIKNPEYPFAADADLLMTIINERGAEPDEVNHFIFDVLHCSILRSRENMIDDDTAKKYLELLQTAEAAAHRNYFTKKQKVTLSKWIDVITDRCNRSSLWPCNVYYTYSYFVCLVTNNEPIVNEEELEEEAEQHGPEGPRRLRFAEAVLSRRTNQIALVLERCFNELVLFFSITQKITKFSSLNQQAVLRTAECLGIQYIYVVKSKLAKRKKITKKLTKVSEFLLPVLSTFMRWLISLGKRFLVDY